MAWGFEPPGDAGGVVTDGTRVFVADSTGMLYGLHPGNQEIEWQRSFENPIGSRRGFSGALRAIDGALYAFTAAMGSVHAQEYTLIRLDPATGETVWTQDPGIGYSVLTILDATADTLLIGASDDQIGDGQDPALAVDVDSGRIRWRATVGDADSGVLGDTRAFIGTYGGVSAVERGSGTRSWRREIRDPTPIFLADGRVFVASKEYEQSRALALESESGVTQWTYDEGTITSMNFGPGGEGPFIGGSQLARLAPDGTPTWRTERGGLIAHTPVTDTVLYGLTESEVFGVITDSGEEVFSYEPGWRYPSPVAIEEDVVIVSAGRSARLGGVTTGGTERWTTELPAEGIGPVSVQNGWLALSAGGTAYGRTLTE